ncbi:hypothetical protein VPH35_076007 [Triticum aestivum]
MGISGVVEWWEEWQLRILVLGSLFIQWLLFLSATMRKLPIPSWFRFMIWLAYLGSDALAIYALATLFGRQSRQGCNYRKGNSILEVVWAPVLLTHLGGQDLITAYNIEDNELWKRHVVTAISQITVAIYVFCKSWPGGEKVLLTASILFFITGILKCIEKPWALKSASINSLVSSCGPGARRRNKVREGGINSLEDYFQKAWAFVHTNPRRQAQEGNAVDLEADNHLLQLHQEDDAGGLEAEHQPQAHGEADTPVPPDQHPQASSTWRSCLYQQRKTISHRLNKQREKSRSRLDGYNVDLETYNLFLDLASAYPDRLGILKSFWFLNEKQAYALLQSRLFGAFDLLYTKRKMFRLWEVRFRGIRSILDYLSGCVVRGSTAYLPWAAIVLFYKSNIEAYNSDDVKVTYALFCCTAVLEFFCLSVMNGRSKNGKGEVNSGFLIAGEYDEQARRMSMHWKWVKKLGPLYKGARAAQLWLERRHKHKLEEQVCAVSKGLKPNLGSLLQFAMSEEVLFINSSVGQYNLVWFFARNKRHSRKMCVANFFNCKDFLDENWSMKPCNSSFPITELVLKYVKEGWEDQMKDAGDYWKFTDRRGQWTLQANKCDQDLEWSLRSPFDESVLLWHIATDFCFYYMDPSADHQCIQHASREVHGCAAWCEISAHHRRAVRCTEISNYMMYLLFVNPEMLLAGTRRNLFKTVNAEVEEILKDDKPSLKEIFNGQEEEIERGVTQRIITMMQQTESREGVAGPTESPLDAETYPSTEEGFIHEAQKISKELLALGDENKMWDVIEGVWVEMLCFSASRCRGYLHAKSLGTGGELLTYIWLLLSHMGMETLPERLQRADLSSGEGNACAPPSTSQTSRSEDPRPHEAAATASASTSPTEEILPAE